MICSLMMDGEVLEEMEAPLTPNGQDAQFVSEMFEYYTSDFSGSVPCVVPGIAKKFTEVAIEMDPMNGIVTTLPVIPLESDRLPEETMAAPPPVVAVDIYATVSGAALGSVMVEDTDNGVRFTPDLTGVTAGEHGFHVHVNLDCDMADQKRGRAL